MTKVAVKICVLICLAVSAANAAEFYVSTGGSDDNPGTKREPFATIQRARDALRVLNDEGVKEDSTVWIRDGVYQLSETLVFGLNDSAPDGHTITYSAYRGEKPILTSGVRIRGWQELEMPSVAMHTFTEKNIWVADVPEAKDGKWSFRTLYSGERMLPRARSKAYSPTTERIDRSLRWTDLNTLNFPKGALKNWSNLEDVEIFIRPNHVWIVNYLGLTSVDEENCVAKTSIPATYNMGRIYKGEETKSFWVENVMEVLDEPGEWVLNTKQGKLYLWPENERPRKLTMAPKLRELIRVEGKNVDEIGGDIPVKGLVFKGLTLVCGDRDVWTNEDKGIQHDWEMWDKGNALLRFRGAENCAVIDCELRNSGGGGIRLDRYAQNIRIEGNYIHDLGGTAILLAGYGPGLKDVNKNNVVINNNIHTCSELHWHNPGIFIWQSGENKILNNRIHDLPYDAIVLSGVRPRFFDITDPVKWTEKGIIPKDVRENMKTIRWDECGNPQNADEARRFAHARNNLIQDNEIHDVMQTLGDGNAIYFSCAGEGNIVRRNLLYLSPRAGGQIRFDDDQEYSTVDQNILIGSGITLKHNNYVTNNVLIEGSVAFKKEIYPGSKITGNIFYSTKKTEGKRGGVQEPYIMQAPKEKIGETNNNLFYTTTDIDLDAFLDKARGLGLDKDSKIGDPMFKDFDNYDFRLKKDSPALKMGIKSIDIEKIGLLDDPAFARIRKQGLVSTGGGPKVEFSEKHK